MGLKLSSRIVLCCSERNLTLVLDLRWNWISDQSACSLLKLKMKIIISLIVLVADDDRDDELIIKLPHHAREVTSWQDRSSYTSSSLPLFHSSCEEIPPKSPWRIEMHARKRSQNCSSRSAHVWVRLLNRRCVRLLMRCRLIKTAGS